MGYRKMYCTCVLALCSILVLAGCPAVSPDIGSTYVFEGQDWTRGEIIQSSPSGELTVLGKTLPRETSGQGFVIFAARISPNGDLIVNTFFGGLYPTRGLPLPVAGVVYGSGQTVVAGVDGTPNFPSSYAKPPGRLRILQTDSALNPVFDRIFGENVQWRVESIIPGEDGTLFLSGTKVSQWVADSTFILELQSDGDILVVGEYGDWETDQSSLLATVRDSAFAINDDIVLAGSVIATNYEHNGRNMGLLKARRDGGLVWLRSFESRGNQDAFALSSLPDGSFLLAGISDDKTPTDRYPYLIKADGDGNEIWSRDDILGFEPKKSDYEIWDMAVDTDGSIVIVGQGRTISYPGGIGVIPIESHGSFIMRLDANGNNIWTKNLGGGRVYGVCMTDRGTYMTAGSNTQDNLNLIEVDRDGNVVN